jgi:hypothetical protein
LRQLPIGASRQGKISSRRPLIKSKGAPDFADGQNEEPAAALPGKGAKGAEGKLRIE